MGKTKSTTEVATPIFNSGIVIEKLNFDPKNPRFPNSLKGTTDEKKILDWMLPSQNVVELISSMAESGFYPGEPLLVYEHQSKYIVVEGNRRLAAAKLLKNPELAPRRREAVMSARGSNPKQVEKIPVLVYENRDQILEYLGYRHITGIKEWDPLAKARYLAELYERVRDNSTSKLSEQEIHKHLARIIGSKADYVARLLAGLAVYEVIVKHDYFGIEELAEEKIEFSILTTALNYSNISSFLGLKESDDSSLKGLKVPRLKELATWAFERDDSLQTRIGESRGLAMLNRVVENDEAIKAFRQGYGLREAYELTEPANEAFSKAINDSRKRLQQAGNLLHQVAIFNQSDEDNLESIVTISRDIIAGLKVRPREDSETKNKTSKSTK